MYCRVSTAKESRPALNRLMTMVEIDTNSPLGVALYTILGALAQLERKMIIERVRAGMANAKSKGKRIGRFKKRNSVLIRSCRQKCYWITKAVPPTKAEPLFYFGLQKEVLLIASFLRKILGIFFLGLPASQKDVIAIRIIDLSSNAAKWLRGWTRFKLKALSFERLTIFF
jgi:hypothetical protein